MTIYQAGNISHNLDILLRNVEDKMGEQTDLIMELADSMLSATFYEAEPGVTLEKVVDGLEEIIRYPKLGEGGRLSKGQVQYVRRLLDRCYDSKTIDGKKYYIYRLK
jgi:hypothetical protein